jgi:hypothetical protein
MAGKYFWIKERHNPQLGVYYVPMGNLTVKEAKKHESPIYGTNYMNRFNSQEAYEMELARLRAEGKKVN